MDVRVVFVGSSPSLKNPDPKVPFKGTRSGAVLDGWIRDLGLSPEHCEFINLTKFPYRHEGVLRKKDVDIGQFHFELLIKCLAVYHGQDKAFMMMMAKMQEAGKLDPETFVQFEEVSMHAYLNEIKKTPTAKIIALGRMAAWGLRKCNIPHHELPHPSGLNHKLNDREWAKKQLELCKEWLYTLPNG